MARYRPKGYLAISPTISSLLPLTGRLWEINQARLDARRLDCPYVFHRKGKRTLSFRKAWKQACKATGLEGILVHDLRRCAVRNPSRAGIPREVAMKITGHKTESVYRRYRIVNDQDLREATARLQTHLGEQVEPPKVASIREAG